MKRFLIILPVIVVIALAGCASQTLNSETGSASSVPAADSNAKEDSIMADENDSSQTIIDENNSANNKGEEDMDISNQNETRITLKIGDTIIPATLNNTVTAQEFRKKLPFTVTASRYEYDFCGTAAELDYDEAEWQDGWTNGDIGYGGGWFALLVDGEEQSQSYKNQMIIGHIDEDYIDTVRNMKGTITITVELAE